MAGITVGSYVRHVDTRVPYQVDRIDEAGVCILMPWPFDPEGSRVNARPAKLIPAEPGFDPQRKPPAVAEDQGIVGARGMPAILEFDSRTRYARRSDQAEFQAKLRFRMEKQGISSIHNLFLLCDEQIPERTLERYGSGETQRPMFKNRQLLRKILKDPDL